MDEARHSEAAFWWRAAEAIPARPERLAPPDVVAAALPPSGGSPADRAPAPASGSGLAAPRPAAAAALHPGRPLRHPHAFFRRPPSPSPSPPAPVAARRRQLALAAGLGGALVFAALTGFGSRVRGTSPLLVQLETLGLAAGLGIGEVSVVGHRHARDADIFRALGPTPMTLASFDVAAARARIEALPWIERATLVRIFPDRLRIEVVERRPGAVWLDGDRRSLVDAEGRLLGQLGSYVPPDLPRIAGAGAPAAAADLFMGLGPYLALRSRIVLAHRIGDRRWDLELANGTRVRLPATGLAAGLARLAALTESGGILDAERRLVDLTLPGRIVVGAAEGQHKAASSLLSAQPL